MILTLNPFTQPTPTVDPVGPETELSNLASDLYIEGHTQRALLIAEKALKIARTVPTLINLSVILEALERFDEALPYAAEANRLNPKDDRAAGLYGEALLRKGDMARGWPLYLQNRNTRSQMKDFIPEWEGPHQFLEGKRLLVIEGEGYGDQFYFLRWLATLKGWGAKVSYICQPTLAPLIKQMGFHALENWGGNVDFRWDDYDYHTSILTLPWKLGVTFENYKWAGPYIKVKKRPWWKRDKSNFLRVGICPLAGEGMSPRRTRSMHASQLQVMLNSLDPCHEWVNLHPSYILPFTVDHPPLNNWLDTAKAISTCDFIVSVDTGVAHLGAAMGILTYVILPGASAWQYSIHREDHPFYPSMKMFRNNGDGMDNSVKA